MKTELNHELRTIAEYVRNLIDLEFERANWMPEPDSTLDQAGLRNGLEIVKDYVEHGESSVAFDHLLHMLEEPGSQLSKDYRARSSDMADEFGRSPGADT